MLVSYSFVRFVYQIHADSAAVDQRGRLFQWGAYFVDCNALKEIDDTTPPGRAAHESYRWPAHEAECTWVGDLREVACGERDVFLLDNKVARMHHFLI